MSRKTRNWIIVLILVPAAAYGVAKLAIWYSVKDAFDNASSTMTPVASVEYTNILSPVFGAFGVTGVRVQPHIFEDQITVGSALVHIDDPIEKYHFLNATMRDTMPTRFNFSLNGIRIPLTGDIGAWFDQNLAMASAMSGASGAGGDAPAGCSLGSPLAAKDLLKMGYDELLANVALDYGFDRAAGGLVTYARIDVRDMFEVILEGRVPGSEVVLAVDRIEGVPKLSDITISLRDLSWSSRLNKYCADAMGISEAQYARRRLEETRQALSKSGFVPSAGLMDALEKFSKGTAQITLSLNPREPIDPTKVNLDEDPDYLIDTLGLELMVDGKPVPELGTVREVAPESDEGDPQNQVVDETYKPTPLQELPQYLKSHVQIFTSDGKVHEGYLDSIDPQKIVLTRHLVGGSVTFDVVRGDVSRVLVLRP